MLCTLHTCMCACVHILHTNIHFKVIRHVKLFLSLQLRRVYDRCHKTKFNIFLLLLQLLAAAAAALAVIVAIIVLLFPFLYYIKIYFCFFLFFLALLCSCESNCNLNFFCLCAYYFCAYLLFACFKIRNNENEIWFVRWHTKTCAKPNESVLYTHTHTSFQMEWNTAIPRVAAKCVRERSRSKMMKKRNENVLHKFSSFLSGRAMRVIGREVESRGGREAMFVYNFVLLVYGKTFINLRPFWKLRKIFWLHFVLFSLD